MGNPVYFTHHCSLVQTNVAQVITQCFSKDNHLYLGNETFFCRVNYCGICGYENIPCEPQEHINYRPCYGDLFNCYKSILYPGDHFLFSNGLNHSRVVCCPFCGQKA